MQLSRGHERSSIVAILIATSLGVVLGSPGSAAQTAPKTPAGAAFEECRVLMTLDLHNRAIARCDEAVRLDPKLQEPYLLLANAHEALWQQDLGRRENRLAAASNYRKFLALNRGDTEQRRQAKHTALSALLATYIFESEREGDLEYANELAKEASLTRRDLLVLTAAYARHDRPDLSEAFMKRQLAADPKDAEACQILARLYNDPVWKVRARFDDSMATLEKCAAMSPGDPAAYYLLATHLWDKSYRDQTLDNRQKLVYVERGLGHIDRALGLKHDFFEAVVYKGLLLRSKAQAVSDAALRQPLLDEAARLQKRALVLKAAGVSSPPGLATSLMQPPAPPPPPPPPPGGSFGGIEGGVPGGVVGGVVGRLPDALPPPQAVRVGGQIKEPRKLTNVSPVYPDIAKQARVQGIVILECTIDTDGRVSDARVLRGIPLLDQAAIDAVRQWVYEPTELYGVPVPVIMTVTANFKLSVPTPQPTVRDDVH